MAFNYKYVMSLLPPDWTEKQRSTLRLGVRYNKDIHFEMMVIRLMQLPKCRWLYTFPGSNKGHMYS